MVGADTGFRSPRSSRPLTRSSSRSALVKALPQRVAGRDLFWWLTKTGLINKTVESRLRQRLKDRDTLSDRGPRAQGAATALS